VALLIEKPVATDFVSWGKFRGLMSNRIHVLKRTVFFILINFLGITVPKNAHAVADFGNAAVLPVGRYQVTFRFGNISEIQDKFDSSGTLQGPSRMNQRMDNAFLMKKEKFRQLAKMIDEQFLPNQKPSRTMDAGTLEFVGHANASYFCPQVARGITPNWSMGVAIPMIMYKSDIHMRNAGVNTAAPVINAVAQKSDQINKQLGATAEIFNGGPKAITASQLQENSYDSISERNETFLGDVTFGSSLKLYDSRYFDFYLVNQLTLPTGPKDDPDDLLDLNTFGKTELQTTLFTSMDVSRRLELGVGLSYVWGIPDDIKKRVPTSDDDSLPATKETVRKDPGDYVGLQLASLVRISSYWQTGAGLEMKVKQKDDYSGGKGSRYDLLEKYTDQQAYIGKFKITYTTIDGFLQGNEKIPYSVTYAFADHIAGKNVERELTHEILMKFYF
jgi:hypothetical protein